MWEDPVIAEGEMEKGTKKQCIGTGLPVAVIREGKTVPPHVGHVDG